MAAVTLYRTYSWLIDTVNRAQRITREEIESKWLNNPSLNENHATRLPARTFHRWREAIEIIFGIEIACDKSLGNIYYIKNKDQLEKSTTYKWLLNTLSVAQLVSDNISLQDKIILEDMPSDTYFLAPLMESIRTQRVAQLTFLPPGASETITFKLKPYCLKAFRRRWYVIGKASTTPKDIKYFSLDRIQDLTLLDTKYTIPDNFDAQVYFRDYFGINRNGQITEPQRMVLEVIPEEADDLRSLPLHRSQRELGEKDGYIYFEYHLVPTFDLYQELLMRGQAVRVVEPELLSHWLKKEAEWIIERYEEDTDEEITE